MLSEIEKLELEEYIANKFIRQENSGTDDSEIISWWRDLASKFRADEILNEYICRKLPVKFLRPEGISVEIYASVAGEIPLVIFDDDKDFGQFITNLFYGGQYSPEVAQMGASFIYGKRQRFLVLSKKFYSNTPPEVVGLSPDEWREKSLILRREHECAHYYTKKFYASAANNLHDELIADFIGLYESLGKYEARIFKYFMGIDGSHEGRLSLYTSGLSEAVKNEIAGLAGKCADNLEAWTFTPEFLGMTKAERINYLCEKDIKNLSLSV